MNSRLCFMYVMAVLSLASGLQVCGAENGDIKTVNTWLGDVPNPTDANQVRAFQQVASLRLVNDAKTWELVWQTIKGKDEKTPEVDFQRNLVFISLTPKTSAPSSVRLVHDGQGNAASLLAATASAFSAGYAMVAFPRESLKTFENRPIPKPLKPIAAKNEAGSPSADEDAKPIAATFRTWMSEDGKYTTVARFVKFAAGRVYLERKSDGKTIDVLSAELSIDDQKHIREFLKQSKKGAR